MKKRYSLCLDFDGVISVYKTPFTNAWTIPDPPVDGIGEWMEEMLEHFDIHVLSARGSLAPWYSRWWHCWMGRRAIRDYLEHWFGNISSRIKVVATKRASLVYIDDRGYRFNGHNLPTKDMIHRLIPWNKEMNKL